MNREYFKSKNQPVLDKYGRILVNEAKVQKSTYPLSEHEAFFPQAEAMFDASKLRDAYNYYVEKTKGLYSPENLFNYLYRLEKDVSLKDQRYQP
jgi:hypothetical protein